MMRRLTRRGRTRSAGNGRAPIDAGRWLRRIVDDGLVQSEALEPVDGDDLGGVPDSFAAVGRGQAADGTTLLVAFSPHSGGDALLAALAGASASGDDAPFEGEAVAVSPQWSAADRRRLGLLGELPFRLRSVEASGFVEAGTGGVLAERSIEPPLLTRTQVEAQLGREGERALFARAASVLEGLAAKHAGAVRGVGRSLELVLLARRVAELCADPGGVLLNATGAQRSSVRLSEDTIGSAFDALEGQLRKRLNDRKVRESEEGTRARAIPVLARAKDLHSLRPWPLPGSDPEVIDLVAVDADGRPVVATAREQLTLPALGAILDAVALLVPRLPGLLSNAGGALRFDAPCLLLAASDFAASVSRVLPLLALAHDRFELRVGRDRGLELAPLGSGDAARSPRRAPRSRRATEPAAAAAPSAEASGSGDETDESREADTSARGRPRRRRGRGRGRRPEGGAGRADDREEPASAAGSPAEPRNDDEDAGGRASRPRFDEVSLFDLDDESRETGEGAESPGRSRRGGRRRRRRRSGDAAVAGEAAAAGDAETDEGRARTRGGDRRRTRRSAGATPTLAPPEPSPAGFDDDEDELSEGLAPLVDEEFSFDEPIESEPEYDDEEEDLGDDGVDPAERRRALEREKRRLARLAKLQVEREREKPPPKPPRRRAAIVALAERDAILASVILARDIRLVEGFWVYPQEDLMTFFRSVATDLREDTPIHVVGFRLSPAHDVLQAASLYSARISWYDHHEWPPEDLEALTHAIGEDAVHVTPHAGSAIPGVLETCNRRSRFSDKLVDLATGRFTQHDYERWGRLWWWRLGQIATRPGERRADIDALLSGRPSDLAKEASSAEAPPLPEEVDYASRRDFRLVHFAGYSLVVVDVPEGLDFHLSGRIVRERYGATLSLTYRQGDEVVVFAGEEQVGRRSFDFGRVVEHLDSKLDSVAAGPDGDHVARFRVRGLAERPELLDEVIGEIAMGRSILEG